MIGKFLLDSSNQRKIALIICGFLTLFSNKFPFLSDINPEMIMTFVAVVGGWIIQGGIKSAAIAHANGIAAGMAVKTPEDAAAALTGLAK